MEKDGHETQSKDGPPPRLMITKMVGSLISFLLLEKSPMLLAILKKGRSYTSYSVCYSYLELSSSRDTAKSPPKLTHFSTAPPPLYLRNLKISNPMLESNPLVPSINAFPPSWDQMEVENPMSLMPCYLCLENEPRSFD